MAESQQIRIIWKTNCKWRDTDYIVSEKDVKLTGEKSAGKAGIPLKVKDAVKVKYGSRWYSAEIVEIYPRENDKVVKVDGSPGEPDSHYNAFLQDQKIRERDWSEQREAKKRKIKTPENLESELECPKSCQVSHNKVDKIDICATSAVDVAKVIEDMKSFMSEKFSRIERRLESLETIVNSPKIILEVEEMNSSIKAQLAQISEQLDTLSATNNLEILPNTSAELYNSSFDKSANDSLIFEDVSAQEVQGEDDDQFQLSTIDVNVLRRLVENADKAVDQDTSTEGELNSAFPTTPTPPSSSSGGDVTTNILPDDVIRKFVTPSKNVKDISLAIDGAKEPRKCALKLLPFFFSDQELCMCNTDGTHGKPALDPVKLNSLKVLLFMRFVFPSKQDEDIIWKGVKATINNKCRANKFYKKRLNLNSSTPQA